MTSNTDLYLITLKIRDGRKTIEDLKTALKENEVIVNTETFRYALQCS